MFRKNLLLLVTVSLSMIVSAQSIGLDPNFGTNGEVVTDFYQTHYPYGKNAVLQSDGKIITGGRFTSSPPIILQRYETDGDLDLSYQFDPITPVFYESVYGIGIQPGDKSVLFYEDKIYRFLPSGLIDSTFGTNGSLQKEIRAYWNTGIHIQPDNKILAYSSVYDPSDSASVFNMVRLTENGQTDSSFADNGNFRLHFGDTYDIPWDVEVDYNGQIVMAGTSFYYPLWKILVLKLTPDGKVDSTFGTNGHIYTSFKNDYAELYGMAIQPDNKIVVTGYTATGAFTDYEFYAARYHPDGTPDSTFGDQGVVYLPSMEGTDIVINPDGKITICAFNFSSESTTLIRLLENGQLDPDFGASGLFSIALDPFEALHPQTMFYTDSNSINITCRKDIPVTSTSFNIRKTLIRISTNLVLHTETWGNDSEPVILVYPNPVTDYIHLKFDLPEKSALDMALVDRSGKVVGSLLSGTVFGAGAAELDLPLPPGLPAGTYFLCLNNGGKTATVQLFKY